MLERVVIFLIGLVVVAGALAADLPRLVAPAAAFVGLYVLVRVVNAYLDRW